MEDYLVDDAIAATAYLFGDLVVVREEVSEVSLDLVVLVRLRDLGLLGIGSHHHLLLLFLFLSENQSLGKVDVHFLQPFERKRINSFLELPQKQIKQ